MNESSLRFYNKIIYCGYRSFDCVLSIWGSDFRQVHARFSLNRSIRCWFIWIALNTYTITIQTIICIKSANFEILPIDLYRNKSQSHNYIVACMFVNIHPVGYSYHPHCNDIYNSMHGSHTPRVAHSQHSFRQISFDAV